MNTIQFPTMTDGVVNIQQWKAIKRKASADCLVLQIQRNIEGTGQQWQHLLFEAAARRRADIARKMRNSVLVFCRIS